MEIHQNHYHHELLKTNDSISQLYNVHPESILPVNLLPLLQTTGRAPPKPASKMP